MPKGFLEKLAYPIVGLAPMDGVTDVAFREMVCKYSSPSFLMTEFVNVEGLARGAIKKLPAFIYDKLQQPIVAQIFGIEVESFYKISVLACHLGFDGVDINMGCPAKKVERKGSGAGLIKNPELAKKIICAVKKGIKDFSNGIDLKEAGVHPVVIEECKKLINKNLINSKRSKYISVSVKTRIGYDKIITEEWIKYLLQNDLDFITLHGRILKQMYIGKASWDEIKKAALLCKKTRTKLFGNGDIQSMEDARNKIKEYGVDGVLVGRAVLGNPWFFGGEGPEVNEKGKKKRIKAAEEHAKYFDKFLKNRMAFHNVKKHLAWYLREFDGCKELREKIMLCENFLQAKKIFSDSLKRDSCLKG